MLASLVPPSPGYGSSKSITLSSRLQPRAHSARSVQSESQSNFRPVSAGGLAFGHAYPLDYKREYPTRAPIDNDVYKLLAEMQYSELHLHQGGSTPVGHIIQEMRTELHKYFDQWAEYEKHQAQLAPGAEKQSGHCKPTPGPGIPSEIPLFDPDGKVIIDKKRILDTEGRPVITKEELKEIEKIRFTVRNFESWLRCKYSEESYKQILPNNMVDEASARMRMAQPADNIPITSKNIEELLPKGLNQYRESSDLINPWAKSDDNFTKVANAYLLQTAREKLDYFEYRVSPTGNGIGGANGSNLKDVLENVELGFKNANASLPPERRVPYGIIVLFERQNRRGTPPDSYAKVEKAINLANEVIQLKKEKETDAQGKEVYKYNICGVDLAGDELNNPVTDFAPAFEIIKQHNIASIQAGKPQEVIGITIHAGEQYQSKDPYGSTSLHGWESIDRAVNIASDPYGITPVRIGHGVQLVNSSPELTQAFEAFLKDPDHFDFSPQLVHRLRASSPLLAKIMDRNVCLEMCPKSNIQTYAVHPGFPRTEFSVMPKDYSAESYKHHPAVFLSRLGVRVAISSDNPTISKTDITNEFVKLFKYGHLTYDDWRRMVLESVRSNFMQDQQEKWKLSVKEMQRFWSIEHDPSFSKAIRKMQGKEQLDSPTTMDPLSQAVSGLTPENYCRPVGGKKQHYWFADSWISTHPALATPLAQSQKPQKFQQRFPDWKAIPPSNMRTAEVFSSPWTTKPLWNTMAVKTFLSPWATMPPFNKRTTEAVVPTPQMYVLA